MAVREDVPMVSRFIGVLAVVVVAAGLVAGTSVDSAAAGRTARFVDVPAGYVFESAVDWMADQGITRGCNPPVNDRFCPDEPVTREQMATFLVRVLFLVDGAGSGQFIDDDSSVHELNIERLARAGVTRGCNPPVNDQFCPERNVTRGQMAAFLGRGLLLVEGAGSDRFVDDDTSVFEADIERLAYAGITLGCNPPDNDRFCPDAEVTRGEMAEFLWRAFGRPGVGEPGLNRVDVAVTTVVSGDDLSSGVLGSDGSVVLAFRSVAAVPLVGRYVIHKGSDAVPEGFVGRVVAVEGVTVTTEPVALSTVIPHGEFSFSVPLENPSMTPLSQFRDTQISSPGSVGEPTESVAEKFGISCGGTNLDVDIDLGIDFLFDGDGSWTPGGDKVVWFTLTAETSARISAAGGIGVSCERTFGPTLYFPPVVMPGPIPPIFPEVAFVAAVDGSLEVIAFDADHTYSVTAGMEYRNGNVTPILDSSSSGDATLNLFNTVDGSIGFSAGPRLTGKMGGVAGLYIQASGALDASYESTQQSWEIWGRAEAAMGLTLDLILVDFNWELASTSIGSRVLLGSGGGLWAACSTQSSIPKTECDALVALYDTTGGDQWVDRTGWLTDPDPCTWYGVACSAGSIVTLWLDNNQLTGPIPPELGNLTSLGTLGFWDNQLSGPIPPELGNLTSLSYLYLNDNQLTGPIPSELGNLTNLANLYLFSNQLSGPIPSELANLTNLTSLILTSNQLSGSIPVALGNLTNLDQLKLSANLLSEPIPVALGNLTDLTTLALDNNQLSGAIPAALGNLTNLETLILTSNQLSGAIPAALGNLTDLTTLALGFNQLSGAIPAALGNLTNLTSLVMSNNQLSGPVPVSLLQLDSTTLSYLALSGQTGCLTASTTELIDWLVSYDLNWNDGC